MNPSSFFSGRVAWLDFLRVFSAFSIVFLHVSSHYLEYQIPFGSFSWFLTDAALAFTRFAVPVFVMISGVFFLSPQKDISLAALYRKYIGRILSVLIGWAIVRTAVMNVWLGHAPAGEWAQDVFISVMWYWFLPMIIGLYMVSPFLRVLTAQGERKLMIYFMTLCLIFAMGLPVLEDIEKFFFPNSQYVSMFIKLIKIPFWVFGAHFMFGYYAFTYEISPRAKKWIYGTALVAWLLIAAGAYVFDDKSGRFYFYSMQGASLSPLTFFTGAALFLATKDMLGKIVFGPRVLFWSERLARYSLGVYMFHLILVELAAHFGLFEALNGCYPVTVPVLAVFIFMLANAGIALLYKIPVFRKHFL